MVSAMQAARQRIRCGNHIGRNHCRESSCEQCRFVSHIVTYSGPLSAQLCDPLINLIK
jgi:hypothetical protein